MRTSSLVFPLFFIAAAASGQTPPADSAVQLTTLSIGTSVTSTTASDMGTGSVVQTDINLAGPASATGTVTYVRLHWGGPCAQSLKIKFFRRVGDQLTMTAERGPLSTPAGEVASFTLDPPVAVQQGDLIGATRLTGCSGARTFWTGQKTDGYIVYAGDVTGSVGAQGQFHDYGILSLSGSGIATEIMRWSIPAVGSTAGSFGSHFRTALQLYNPGDSAISGRLVFHPAGVNGAPSDPSMVFSLGPRQLQAWNDVVAAMGQSGLGSLDILGPFSDTPPVAVTRVYDDAGSAGTSGFTQDAMNMDGREPRLLAINDVIYLVSPPDPSKARFNIGVRTFSSGVWFSTKVWTAAGGDRGGGQKSYPANYFAQVDAKTFLYGATLNPNDTIQIQILGGTAAIYGSTTDNTTNDSAIQFATRHE